MLVPLEGYIKAHQPVTEAQLSRHFHIQGPALEGMLALLLKRGRIGLLSASRCGGGCGCSNAPVVKGYIWKGRAQLPLRVSF